MSETRDGGSSTPRDPGIQPGIAVRLSARVRRITAPNPGAMTGPGTNSYLVGAGERWAVIDPGPADDRHVRALMEAAPQAIHHILVTHTHEDHSPGAAPLKSATGALLLGRTTCHRHWQDSTFVPDRELRHDDRLTLVPGCTLRVIHTPGHASNHLCFLLEDERILFTGDHIIQGSTVVIDPPDGDMAAYIASLEALLREPIDYLAPGHGTLIPEPHAAIQGLIQHRLRREAKVLAALSHQHPADLPCLVRCVYDDVPPHLHPIAERSLLAHLLKLQSESRARRIADSWIAPH
ncbi:MAG TPA: MBL fold metallo-hydrolase [Steroidobacteraceae bacterium]|jgi:glyoxylase-like metal-dependent hydrolase (beta-lactamase superfamily II)|nr:MBL fold metallo-hydrolase [Steroidobacteraceae bacterium]